MNSINFLFFFLCVICRGLDFLSTYLVTPGLKLEGNLIAKKLGWKIMFALNFLLCVLSAYSIESTVIICTASLLVSGNNFGRGLIARGLGEERFRNLFNAALKSLSTGIILVFTLSYGFIYIILGSVIYFFAESYIVNLISQGIIVFGIAIIIHMNISIFKSRKAVKSG